MAFRLVEVEQSVSTNETLMRASPREYPFGTALLARRQSGGRGRAGRRWASPEGGLYLSLLFRPRAVEGLSLLGAHSVVRLCRDAFALPALIRWPNDVYLDGKKLAGILPQVKFRGERVERAVLGIGWNVAQPKRGFPSEIAERVTTLSHHLSETPPVRELALRLLELLEEELGLLRERGVADLCRRSERYLEGLEPGLEAYLSGPEGDRLLGRVIGLGPAGELRLGAGETVERLGVDERLVLRPPHTAPPLDAQ